MEPVLSDMNIRFNYRLNELISYKGQNTQIFTKAAYRQMIKVVRKSKSIKSKSPADHQRMLRYDVIFVGNEERLIAPAKDGGEIRHYVHTEEIFKILHDAHIAIGHGGRNRMEKEIGAKYKNITREMIVIFLSLCQICQRKNTGSKRSSLEANISKELISRCRVDLLQMKPAGDCQYVLVYQDHPTKFVQLRALKTRSAEEVATTLMDIFAVFGAPNVLQAENADEVIGLLSCRWPELRMASGRYLPGEEYLRDVERALCRWLEANGASEWPEGLRFVQLAQNRAHRLSLCCSPFEALFGTKMKLGLRSCVPEEALDGIRTERDLGRFFKIGEWEELCLEAGIDIGGRFGP